MKPKYILALTAILLSVSFSQAQNSGFMGKRIVFNMEATFLPAWLKPNFANNPKYHYQWYSFNYTLSPNIECIAWKMGTAGLVYHYFTTKYDYPRNTNGNYIIGNDPTDIDSELETLKSHGFGIFYKQYLGSRAYAPMGSYLKLQFDGFFYKRPNDNLDRTMVNDRLFALKIEFGQDFLFFNILRLSTGVSLGVPFGGFDTMFDEENYFFDNTGINVVERYAKGRIASHYWLGFNVGIGVIPF
ncbi:MAG: hypothetical protein LBG80_01065 [Bacteroidales bacterium]|jgi:hypothetical protein|nr:hypothetical protein [Bacteroidales bacterium]